MYFHRAGTYLALEKMDILLVGGHTGELALHLGKFLADSRRMICTRVH